MATKEKKEVGSLEPGNCQICNIMRYSSKESMKRSGSGSGRIVKDLGKVLGGVLGKRSSGSKRIWGTKYHNPKDKS